MSRCGVPKLTPTFSTGLAFGSVITSGRCKAQAYLWRERTGLGESGHYQMEFSGLGQLTWSVPRAIRRPPARAAWLRKDDSTLAMVHHT